MFRKTLAFLLALLMCVALFPAAAYADDETGSLSDCEHDWETVEGRLPTCSETGLTDGLVCRLCGDVIQYQETLDALGHEYGSYFVSVPPVPGNPGTLSRICAVCGDEETSTFTSWSDVDDALFCAFITSRENDEYIVSLYEDGGTELDAFTARIEAVSSEELKSGIDAVIDELTAPEEPQPFTMELDYPEVIVCGEPVTFRIVTSGGTGECKYLFNGILDSERNLVTDPTKYSYTTAGTFDFTFYASGTYYLTFYAMDTGLRPVENLRRDITLTIDDKNYPSVDEKVSAVAAQCVAAGCATDYEKALWLHDWLTENSCYDNSLKYCGPEGTLCRGTGTCESYHRAYCKLLAAVGVESGRITGNGHVWTAVKMDGKWYQVDVTWDDPGYSSSVLDISHLYFGLDDRLMHIAHSDHSANAGYESVSLDDNYFIRSGAVKEWSSMFTEDIISFLDEGLESFSIPVPSSPDLPVSWAEIIYSLAAYDLSNSSWECRDAKALLSASYSNGSIDFTADYGRYSYTLTFNKNNPKATGSMPSVNGVNGTSLTLPACAFRLSGCSFDSWNTEPDGSGVRYDGSGVITEIAAKKADNITLYAQWKTAEYPVTYSANGGTGAPEGQTKLYGTALRLSSEIPSREGCTFKGWAISKAAADKGSVKYKPGASYTSNSPLSLYAVWNIPKYKVTLKPAGGSVKSASLAKLYGENLVLPQASRKGYTFLGWSETSDGSTGIINEYSSNKAAVLYAQWQENSYTVRLFAGGSEIGSAVLRYTEKYIPADPGYAGNAGYHITSWKYLLNAKYKTASLKSYVSKLCAGDGDEIILEAVFAPNTYTVMFNPENGSTKTVSQSFRYGDKPRALKANSFKKTGFSFSHWEDSEGNAFMDKAPVSNLTTDADGIFNLCARWDEHSYSLRAVTGCGEEADALYGAVQLLYTERFTLPEAPDRPGWSFDGWQIKSGRTVIKYSGVSVLVPGADVSMLSSKDGAQLTLNALWTKQK